MDMDFFLSLFYSFSQASLAADLTYCFVQHFHWLSLMSGAALPIMDGGHKKQTPAHQVQQKCFEMQAGETVLPPFPGSRDGRFGEQRAALDQNLFSAQTLMLALQNTV